MNVLSEANLRRVFEVIVRSITHICTAISFISQSVHALQATLSFWLSASTPRRAFWLMWPLMVTRFTPLGGVVSTSMVRSAVISQTPCLPKPILTQPVSGMIWQYGAVAEVDKSFQSEDAGFKLGGVDTIAGATDEALPVCLRQWCWWCVSVWWWRRIVILWHIVWV